MKLLVKTKNIPSRRRGGHVFGIEAIEVEVSSDVAKAIYADAYLVASELPTPVLPSPPKKEKSEK